jgi:tellurite resistance protein
MEGHPAESLLAKVLADEELDDLVLDAITLSASADGLVPEELVALKRMARELPSSRDLDEAGIEDRIQRSFERAHRDGLYERLRALGDMKLNDEMRHRIFSAAAIVQYADGHVTNEENEFLLDLADVLGLNETKVRGIIADIERDLDVAQKA